MDIPSTTIERRSFRVLGTKDPATFVDVTSIGSAKLGVHSPIPRTPDVMSHILTRCRCTICARLNGLTRRLTVTIGRFSWCSIAAERNTLKTSRDGARPDIIPRAEPTSPNRWSTE